MRNAGRLLALGLLLASNAAHAVDPAAVPAAAVAPAAATAGPAPLALDVAELGAWSDRVFGDAFAHGRFSALSLTVVVNGAIVLERGYGYASWPERRPIDPERTEFLLGSVTKTFTATAIAQLLESGSIRSLDEPVNRYLKRFRLPGERGAKVTFWHVLTHSAGFELRNVGLGSYEAHELPLTAAQLEHARAAIVREPGTLSSYANFGTALLAAVVEDVTGQRIDEYMKAHVLAPLGMRHSRMNVTPERPAALVHAYRVGGAGEPPELAWLPFSALAGPMGAISATPHDVVRYMNAHMGLGEPAAQPILSPQTLALMHEPHFGNHPDSMVFGMQFFTSRWNGQRIVEHGGMWPYNVSMMTMLPDAKLSFYVATVGDSEPPAQPMPAWEVRGLLLTKLFGPQSYPTIGALPANLAEYEGAYQHTQRNYTTLEAVPDLVQASTGPRERNDAVKVVAQDGHGGLVIAGIAGYLPIGGDRFWKKDFVPNGGWPGPLYTFQRDASGHVVRLTDYFSTESNERVTGLSSLANRGRLAQLLALVLATGLLAAFWRTPTPLGGAARWASVLGAVLVVALPLALFHVPSAGGFAYYLISGRTGRWLAFAALANALVAIALLTAWAALRGWDGAPAGLRVRLSHAHCTLLALAGLAFAAVLWSVNAVGLHLP